MTNITFAVQVYKPLTARCGSALKIRVRKKSEHSVRIIFETDTNYGRDSLPRDNPLTKTNVCISDMGVISYVTVLDAAVCYSLSFRLSSSG